MSSSLEKSLDEIIGSNDNHAHRGRKNFRRNSKNGRVSKPRFNAPRPNNFNNGNRNQKIPHGKPNEIKIKNLNPELSESDLFKLMETIGPVEDIEIKMNTHGRSTGLGFVRFFNPKDANLAIKKFDGRIAAGQTIYVESTLTLFDRIRTNVPNAGNNNIKKNKNVNKQKAKPRREKKSLEDLDKELSMYMNGESGETIAESSTEPVAEPVAVDAVPMSVETADANVSSTVEPVSEPLPGLTGSGSAGDDMIVE